MEAKSSSSASGSPTKKARHRRVRAPAATPPTTPGWPPPIIWFVSSATCWPFTGTRRAAEVAGAVEVEGRLRGVEDPAGDRRSPLLSMASVSPAPIAMARVPPLMVMLMPSKMMSEADALMPSSDVDDDVAVVDHDHRGLDLRPIETMSMALPVIRSRLFLGLHRHRR